MRNLCRIGMRKSRNRRLRLFEKICARHQTRPRFYFPSSPLWTTEECRSPLRRRPVPLFLRSFVRYPPLKTAKSLPLSAVRPLTAAAASKPAPAPRRRAPPACFISATFCTHSLTLPLPLSSISLRPALLPSCFEGGREAISHSKYAHQSDMDSPPPLPLPPNRRRQPPTTARRERATEERLRRPSRSMLATARQRRPALADTFPNMKYPPPARCRACAGAGAAPSRHTYHLSEAAASEKALIIN